MISITCTHCHTLLTIDDAFAGGACRCQHCGTIQTVPIQGKSTMRPAHPGPITSKALYQNRAAPSAQSAPSGLDDLASAVASGSGIGSSRLGAPPGATSTSRRQVAPAPASAPPASSPPASSDKPARKVPVLPIAIGGGVVLLALIGIIIFLALRGSGHPATSGTGGASGPASPSFAGLNLNVPSVVFLIDRGNNMADAFDPVKAATYQVLGKMGPEKKFAVVLWNNETTELAYPADGLASASPEGIDGCKKAIEDVVATGQSTLRGALEKAMSKQPAVIVIITGKPHLEEEDETALSAAREKAAGHIKFDACIIGNDVDNLALQALTLATGGEYRKITERDLRASVQ